MLSSVTDSFDLYEIFFSLIRCGYQCNHLSVICRPKIKSPNGLCLVIVIKKNIKYLYLKYMANVGIAYLVAKMHLKYVKENISGKYFSYNVCISC